MNSFLRRIRRLREQLTGPEVTKVIVVYSDGSESTMDGNEAFLQVCTNKDVVNIRCQNENEQSFFDALGPGFDCAELWKDSHS